MVLSAKYIVIKRACGVAQHDRKRLSTFFFAYVGLVATVDEYHELAFEVVGCRATVPVSIGIVRLEEVGD